MPKPPQYTPRNFPERTLLDATHRFCHFRANTREDLIEKLNSKHQWSGELGQEYEAPVALLQDSKTVVDGCNSQCFNTTQRIRLTPMQFMVPGKTEWLHSSPLKQQCETHVRVSLKSWHTLPNRTGYLTPEERSNTSTPDFGMTEPMTKKIIHFVNRKYTRARVLYRGIRGNGR
ncbi:hypothetical protein BDV93DRAFT_513640 [Ceratobasidium sp. AG-I]|nr:hypothetical protein BDV93DRAFT_513640 [Ceratobasidium sp. AG-I]